MTKIQNPTIFKTVIIRIECDADLLMTEKQIAARRLEGIEQTINDHARKMVVADLQPEVREYFQTTTEVQDSHGL